MKRILSLFSLFLVQFLFAQVQAPVPGNSGPGSHSLGITSSNGFNLDCTTNCTDLTATFTEYGATDTYIVQSIPFDPVFPFTGLDNQVFFTGGNYFDDQWSPVIDLPFDFCFFGDSYDQVQVGGNGVIRFDVNPGDTSNNWAFTEPLPNNANPTLGEANIFGAAHDMDPSVGDPNLIEIGWSIKGVAPFRAFIYSYSNVPQFSCNNLRTTQQMIFYETTNIIEVLILNKPTCFGWNPGGGINGGNAVIGIQNNAGTVAYTPPNRNTGNWTGFLEAWQFVPSSGLPSDNYTFTWLDDAGAPISNNQTINVCPAVTTTYTAQVEYTPDCGFPMSVVTMDVIINKNATGDASFTMNANCDGGTATITGDTGGVFSFNPVPTDGATIDPATGEVTNGVTGVTYTVEYATTGACPANSTETVTVLAAGDASFSMTATCDGGTATIIGTTGGTFTFSPLPTDGATIDAATGTVTNGVAGTAYTIDYAISGACAANSTETVTVLAAEDATFSMTATCDGGTASITGDTGGTFAFNPAPTDTATIDSATGTVTGGTPGATYTIEYTTPGVCAASSTETVTVQSAEDASFNMTATCDGGTAIITGDNLGSFALNPVPTDGAIINSVTGEVTGGASGVTYTVEYSTNGLCPESSTQSVTVLTADDASFTMNPNCDGGTATITGTSGGTFAFNPAPTDTALIDSATGEVTGGTSGATYTVEYTTAGACSESSTQTVTVLATGDASFSMTATCDGGTAAITGTTGGTFSFNPVPTDGATIDAATGTVTNGISGTTYNIDYATTGACAASSTEMVTVLAAENASFTMTATCGGATATITGDTGGTFALNPAVTDGAVIDTATGEITSGVSTTTYTVEYTTAGSCAETTTQTVTILTTDDASFTMNPNCDGGTATITGTSGGTFAFNPTPTDTALIDSATGEVTGGTSGATYTVEYTTAGACSESSTQTVTVLATGDASFSMTATCDGGTAAITGTTGGTFSFNPVPTDGATIDAATGTVTNGISGTTYNIDYATTGACAASSTEMVTVLAAENASFTMTATCGGATATITGDTGGTFALNPAVTDGAVIDTATGEITSGVSATTYTVEYTTAGSCAETTTQTVTILTTDDASFVTNPNCDGGTATITGTMGGTFAFNPVPTDTAAIDSATGEVTGGTSGATYTIEYTTAGVCPLSSTQTITVLTAGDASFNMTATCDGGTAAITGTTGGAFSFNPAPTDGATIDAVTGAVSNGVSGTSYTIEYATTGACAASSMETVTVLPVEDASFSVFENCDGGLMTILGDTGGTFAFNPAPTDGATIDTATGTVSNGASGVTYVVEYTTAGPCFVSSTQNVTVLVTDDPSFTVTATCDGGTANVTGVTGGTFAFNPAPTDTATIDTNSGAVTNATSGASYTIEYTTAGTCPATDTQVLTVLVTDDSTFTMAATCDGGTATITGVSGGSFAFNPLPTDTATVDVNTGEITNGTSGATYSLEYTTSGVCPSSSIASVTVHPAEDATFTLSANCEGGIASITGDTGGVFNFSPLPTDTATIDAATGEITNGTSGATYTVMYTTSGPCSVNSTQNVTVIITDDPSFSMTANCDGGTASVLGTTGGTFVFSPAPTDTAIIDAATGEVTNGTSGASYTIEYTTNGTCPASQTQVLTVITTDDPAFTMTATCDGGTASVSGTTGGTFAFNPMPADTATVNVNTGEITNGTSGATYSLEYTTSGVCPSSSIASVTVHPAEDATFVLNPNCDGGTATIIGDAGGVFTFNPIPGDAASLDAASGDVTNGTSGATYTVEYTTSGPCSVSTTQNVTVFIADDASFTMIPTCDGATANVTGTSGGIFDFDIDPADGSIIDSVTGEVTNAIPGDSYSILYTTAGACMDSQVMTFTVNPRPIVDLQDTFILCMDNNGNIVNDPTMDTGLSTLDYSFEWTEATNPTTVLGTDSFYEPVLAGTYSVFITNNSTGCVTVVGDPNTMSVVTNSIPPTGLEAIIVSETFASENVIQASVDAIPGANYEFSIDNGPFVSNGTNVYTFGNVTAGSHTITVRDADGCGDDSTTVLVVDYPLFFTPNNDGHNDTWRISGINPDAVIHIFDRYGKLVKQLSPTSIGWDGTFNGQPLPSSDYWFSLEYRDPNNLEDTSVKEFRAHFTLKR